MKEARKAFSQTSGLTVKALLDEFIKNSQFWDFLRKDQNALTEHNNTSERTI